MGRQIRFVHTEEDISQFLSSIEENHGRILLDGVAVLPTCVEDAVLYQMNSKMCQFEIVDSARDDWTGNMFHNHILNGVSIEFSNCTKGNSYSRTYEIGRLYISQRSSGGYDAQTLALFEKLRKYIKKHYQYSQKAQIYTSASFLESYALHRVYVTQLGRKVLI